jgi:hypothetical protein
LKGNSSCKLRIRTSSLIFKPLRIEKLTCRLHFVSFLIILLFYFRFISHVASWICLSFSTIILFFILNLFLYQTVTIVDIYLIMCYNMNFRLPIFLHFENFWIPKPQILGPPLAHCVQKCKPKSPSQLLQWDARPTNYCSITKFLKRRCLTYVCVEAVSPGVQRDVDFFREMQISRMQILLAPLLPPNPQALACAAPIPRILKPLPVDCKQICSPPVKSNKKMAQKSVRIQPSRCGGRHMSVGCAHLHASSIAPCASFPCEVAGDGRGEIA